MERDPGEFERPDEEAHDDGEDNLDGLIAGLSDSRDDIDAAIAEAREDVAAGRSVRHCEVVEWLKTWGTPEFKPMPEEWLR